MVFPCTTQSHLVAQPLTVHCCGMPSCEPNSRFISPKAVHVRTSELCCGTDVQLDTVGSYNFACDTWKLSTETDIKLLNSLLSHHSNHVEVDRRILCSVFNQFFPKASSTLQILRLLEVNNESLQTSNERGHPLTVEFQQIFDVNHSTNSTCIPSISSSNLKCVPHSLSVRNHTSMNFISTDTSDLVDSLHAMQHPKFVPTSHSTSPPYIQADTRSPKRSLYSRETQIIPKQYSNCQHIKSCLTNSTRFAADTSPDESILPSPPPFTVTFEFSAGLCVFRRCRRPEWEVLVIRRVDDDFYELPKGHLEHGETLQVAAERELREETGLLNEVIIKQPILSEIYSVHTELSLIEKSVHYFVAEIKDLSDEVDTTKIRGSSYDNFPHSYDLKDVSAARKKFPYQLAWFGSTESKTCEICWVTLKEAQTMRWKSNTISFVVASTLRKQFNSGFEESSY